MQWLLNRLRSTDLCACSPNEPINITKAFTPSSLSSILAKCFGRIPYLERTCFRIFQKLFSSRRVCVETMLGIAYLKFLKKNFIIFNLDSYTYQYLIYLFIIFPPILILKDFLFRTLKVFSIFVWNFPERNSQLKVFENLKKVEDNLILK